MVTIAVAVGALALLAAIVPSIFFSVRQQSNVIIERFGKFHRISNPGLHVKIPVIDRKAGTSDLRIQQLDIQVETKTKDNVFVNVVVAVQYQVNPERVYDSHYKLSNHQRQITSYVFDTIRANVPTMNLDDVFERKDDIAENVSTTIGNEMSEFGYNIVKTLVADVNPAENVKIAMNDINAAQRKRVATQELAEAEKIRTITDAQARAESQRLQGVGIADQRKAIIEGFAGSLDELKEKNIDADSIIQVILFTQYLDTLAQMGENGTNSILLPGSPSGMTDLFSQVRDTIVTGNVASQAINNHTSDAPHKPEVKKIHADHATPAIEH